VAREEKTLEVTLLSTVDCRSPHRHVRPSGSHDSNRTSETVAPRGASRSGRGRSSRKGRALCGWRVARHAELDGWLLGARSGRRWCRLLRFRERCGDVLTQRAIRRVDANAVRRGRRLDVRVGARARGISLEARVGDGHHRRHQELQKRGHAPQQARQAGRSPHAGRLSREVRRRHDGCAREQDIGSHLAASLTDSRRAALADGENRYPAA